MLTIWKLLFETGQKVNQPKNCALSQNHKKGGKIQKLANSDFITKYSDLKSTIKFMFSKKSAKNYEIFTVALTNVKTSKRQFDGEEL